MNLPNKISVFRIILMPIIFVLISISSINEIVKINFNINNFKYEIPITLLISGILFLICIISDWLDGYIARKYNLVTNLGKLLDAIADKILVNSVIIGFLFLEILPVWIAFILIIRDFIIDALRLTLSIKKNHILPASKIGKYKSAIIMVGLFILFFFNYKILSINDNKISKYNIINQLLLLPIYIGSILSIYSGINYFLINYKILKLQNNEKKDSK